MLGRLGPRGVRLNAALVVPSIVRGSGHSRHGGDRRSIIREWRALQRATAGGPVLPSGGLGDRPLVVLTCAPGDDTDTERLHEAWHELHRDLAGLSANSRHVVSVSPGHYLNFDDPDLVVSAIRDVVRCARSGAQLVGMAVASDAD